MSASGNRFSRNRTASMNGSRGKKEFPISSWESWKQIAAVALAAAVGACGACAAANPYCVAGWGVLSKLNMPAESLDYDWNWLREDAAVEMGHWDVGDHRWHHYDPSIDQIIDAPRFRLWVTDHPGKIWLLGNEPDAQGITPAVYARMFHRYYEEIHPRDPSAKFAITALTGGATTAQFNVHSNWFAQALNEYRTQFGVIMPIDIWNLHQYSVAGQIEDPNLPINEYVKPFIEWCHSVESNAYASAEMWITELPIATWSSALQQEHVIWYAQQFLPRLERAGVSRFFWFVSQDWDGNYHDVGLVSLDGSVSALGQAYSALARSYPNAVPPIVPFVPYPTPETVLFDFSGAFGSPWFNKGGWWSNTNGELRHTGIYPWPGTGCCPLYVYQDFGLSFRMKVNSAPADVNWGGVLLRAACRLHTHSDSGYLFFVRKNGEANLYDKVDGIVASVPGTVADPTVYHNYEVYVSGFHITCCIDGVKRIDWTDPNSRYASGYVSAQVYKADASYDDFALAKFPRPAVTISGFYPAGFTFSFSTAANSSLTYYLEYTTSLTPPIGWTTIASTPGTGASADLTDPNPPDSQRFYRVRVQ